MLSQVPPQTIYVNENCEGIVPDLSLIAIVLENCEGPLTFIQSPDVGTILTVANPSIEATLQVIDAFGNPSNILIIPLSLLDTIPPILSWPEGQVAMTEKGTMDLWNNFIAAAKVNHIGIMLYDSGWRSDPVIDSLWALSDTTMLNEQLHWMEYNLTITAEEEAVLNEYLDIINQY